MRICVVGTGYVGLVAGSCFADVGNEVVCVDVDETKVEKLTRGELPIFEPGLDVMVKRNLAEERQSFTTDLAAAVQGAQVIILAVGTPQGDTGAADLRYLLQAAEGVARSVTAPAIVVTKSTVPVGTADRLTKLMAEHTKHPVTVCSNPEFLKEGDAVNDFMSPERVIIGTSDPHAAEVLRALYEPFSRTHDRFLLMSPRAAELTKYAANAMLATRISFMNEIAELCDRVGVDVELVRKGMGSDSRIGPKFLYPGVGYGGSCFPKDIQALLHTGREFDAPLKVLHAVEEVNRRQKHLLCAKITKHCGALEGKRIGVWGLAFKPGTDDIREAPALTLIRELLDAGAQVTAHDPVAVEVTRAAIGDHPRLLYGHGPYDVLGGAHALALVTEWREYRRPNFERMKKLMAEPVLFDGRNIWNSDEVKRAGFTYHGIGRS